MSISKAEFRVWGVRARGLHAAPPLALLPLSRGCRSRFGFEGKEQPCFRGHVDRV